MRSTGAANVLVLLQSFADDDVASLPPPSYFEELFNGEGESDINPVGSIKEWFQENSYGNYDPSFVIEGYETAARNDLESDFSFEEIAATAVLQLDTLDADGFDWSRFDDDGDGVIDGMIILTTGFGPRLGNENCTDPLSRSRTDYTGGTWSNGAYETKFMVSSVWQRPNCRDDRKPVQMARIVHEFMFAELGAESLSAPDSRTQSGGVGIFDTMGYFYGWTVDGTMPGYLSGYTKMQMGWLDPIPIDYNGAYAAMPAETSRQIYIIERPYPEGEYLMIENRFGVRWASDAAGQGFVVYHVDEKVKDQSGRGYPGQRFWPSNHKRVMILQADGLYEIEQGINNGDPGDMWSANSANNELGPGPNVWPNTDSYQDEQVVTGLRIIFPKEPSMISLFEVSGLIDVTVTESIVSMLDVPTTSAASMGMVSLVSGLLLAIACLCCC